jgi:hypothetical protein
MLEWIQNLLPTSVTDFVKKWLSNDWMTAEDFKGKAAHTLGGYAVMMTIGFLTSSLTLRLIAWGALLAYTVAKEFWYDTQFETPVQTLSGALTDFKWYHVGAAVAMAVITLL